MGELGEEAQNIIRGRQLTRLTPIQDKELWVVRGRGADGQEWELPVYATRLRADDGTEWVGVRHAGLLKGDQAWALDERLEPYSYGQVANFGRLLRPGALELIGYKAPGVTPSCYVTWPWTGQARKAEPEFGVIDAPEDGEGELVRYLSARTGILTRAVARLVVKALQQAVREFLVIQRKPVDLGLVRLWPVPLRRNWAVAIQNAGVGLDRLPLDETKLEQGRFGDLVTDGWLLALEKAGDAWTAGWTVEVELLPGWDKENHDTEASLLGTLGPTAYAERVTSYLRRGLNWIGRLYGRWLRDNAKPSAELEPVSSEGQYLLRPLFSRYRGRAIALNPRTEVMVVAGNTSSKTGLGQGSGTAPILWGMSDLQPGPGDVRDAVSDLGPA